MASIDLDKMLAKIKASQWALADIDWDAPGADTVSYTHSPSPRDKRQSRMPSSA